MCLESDMTDIVFFGQFQEGKLFVRMILDVAFEDVAKKSFIFAYLVRIGFATKLNLGLHIHCVIL